MPYTKCVHGIYDAMFCATCTSLRPPEVNDDEDVLPPEVTELTYDPPAPVAGDDSDADEDERTSSELTPKEIQRIQAGKPLEGSEDDDEEEL